MLLVLPTCLADINWSEATIYKNVYKYNYNCYCLCLRFSVSGLA